jgi:hypothetical protein
LLDTAEQFEGHTLRKPITSDKNDYVNSWIYLNPLLTLPSSRKDFNGQMVAETEITPTR